jgi:hypothetical protein
MEIWNSKMLQHSTITSTSGDVRIFPQTAQILGAGSKEPSAEAAASHRASKAGSKAWCEGVGARKWPWNTLHIIVSTTSRSVSKFNKHFGF